MDGFISINNQNQRKNMSEYKCIIKTIKMNNDYVIDIGDNALGANQYDWDHLTRFYVMINRVTPREQGELIEFVEVNSHKQFGTPEEANIYVEWLLEYERINGITPDTQFKR